MFDQYLGRADLPVLELAFDDEARTLAYRWRADERAFAMPIRAGDPSNWQTFRPATDWQIMKTTLGRDSFEVATDLSRGEAVNPGPFIMAPCFGPHNSAIGTVPWPD